MKKYNRHFVLRIIRNILEEEREAILKGEEISKNEIIISKIIKNIDIFSKPILKEVINATGVIIHTNLGRSPLGDIVLKDIKNIVKGYSNLEFNLEKGNRGKRNVFITSLLKQVTGAEDATVVNNNAAALMLILNTYAKDREVIISRGELVEIGGSFRIPEILSASGAKMVEVGTTNKTHIHDYQSSINDKTALILKVHTSNYLIQGFTDEVLLKDLIHLAHDNGLPLVYDIGSGLLSKSGNIYLENEPDVKNALDLGADIVTFSGDKLLGGPQAGIIVGKKEHISPLKKTPMMRALRVGKLTLSSLSSVIRGCVETDGTGSKIPVMFMLERKEDDLCKSAEYLTREFCKLGISAEYIESEGQCGGGSLPGRKIKSYAVVLQSGKQSQKERSEFAENIFYRLLNLDKPIVTVLRKGMIMFDVLTLKDKDFPYIIKEVKDCLFMRK